MSQPAPTVKYQLISKELHELAQKVEEKSREDKDVALAEFVRRHPKYLIIGLGHHGRIKIVFDRNMINYWKRCGEDVDRFREIFFCNRPDAYTVARQNYLARPGDG